MHCTQLDLNCREARCCWHGNILSHDIKSRLMYSLHVHEYHYNRVIQDAKYKYIGQYT